MRLRVPDAARPPRRRGARLRRPARLSRTAPVPRLHRRSLRESHRRRALRRSDGRGFALTANDGPHTLHGGARGFDKVTWDGGADRRRGRRAAPPQPRRRRGLPRQPRRARGLPPRRRRAAHRVSRDERRAHRRQPREPRLLEPRRRRRDADPRSPPVDRRVALHAGRRAADPDRRASQPVAGTPLRLPTPRAIGERIER